MLWTRKQIDGWHKWFAWHPIIINNPDLYFNYVKWDVVWLEWVERRNRAEYRTDGWEYRTLYEGPRGADHLDAWGTWLFPKIWNFNGGVIALGSVLLYIIHRFIK